MRILITGAHGFVGHAVCDELRKRGYEDILGPTRQEVDFVSFDGTTKYFEEVQPEAVIHLAGLVGGIKANRDRPADFFYQNMSMGVNIYEWSKHHGVRKTVVLAAGCGYPDKLEVPFKESEFFDGFPDENSYGYSMAKKMLVVQAMAYKEQYGLNSTVLLPANIYGPHDNFDLESSHVIPALVRKFVEAELSGIGYVQLWGDGTASREFIHVEDVARAVVDCVDKDIGIGPFNLGTGVETTIKELADTLNILCAPHKQLRWNSAMPNGQQRRFYDMSKFEKEFGYCPPTSLAEGLRKTVEWYRENRV